MPCNHKLQSQIVKWGALALLPITLHSPSLNAQSIAVNPLFTASPTNYGTGQTMGMQACPYEMRRAEQYDRDGYNRKENASLARADKMRAQSKKMKEEMRSILRDLEKGAKEDYFEFVAAVATTGTCESADNFDKIDVDHRGPFKDKDSYSKFCVNGKAKFEELCKQREFYKEEMLAESRPGCVDNFKEYKELSSDLSTLLADAREIERDSNHSKREREMSKFRSSGTEGRADCNCDIDDDRPKTSAWTWGLAGVLDLVSLGANISANRADRRYYEDNWAGPAGFAPPAPPGRPWLGPQLTASVLARSLSGYGSGSYGCAPGANGSNGYPFGPSGAFGPYGLNAGIYGGGGSPWGYPPGYGGQFPRFPGGPAGFGGPFSGGGPGGFGGPFAGGGPAGFGGRGGYPFGGGGGYPFGGGGGYPFGGGGGYPFGGGGGYPFGGGGGYPFGGGGGYPFGGGGPGGYSLFNGGAYNPYTSGGYNGAPGGGLFAGAQSNPMLNPLYLQQMQMQMQFEQERRATELDMYQRYSENQINAQQAQFSIYSQMSSLNQQLVELQQSQYTVNPAVGNPLLGPPNYGNLYGPYNSQPGLNLNLGFTYGAPINPYLRGP